MARKSSFEVLQKNKKPLTKAERDTVMNAKATWHHGRNGKPSPAVWKSKDSNGKVTFVTNTHRTYGKASTVEGAIKKYNDYVKDSA